MEILIIEKKAANVIGCLLFPERSFAAAAVAGGANGVSAMPDPANSGQWGGVRIV